MLSGVGPKDELKRHDIPLIQDLKVGFNLQDHVSTMDHIILNKTKMMTQEEWVVTNCDMEMYAQKHMEICNLYI